MMPTPSPSWTDHLDKLARSYGFQAKLRGLHPDVAHLYRVSLFTAAAAHRLYWLACRGARDEEFPALLDSLESAVSDSKRVFQRLLPLLLQARQGRPWRGVRVKFCRDSYASAIECSLALGQFAVDGFRAAGPGTPRRQLLRCLAERRAAFSPHGKLNITPLLAVIPHEATALNRLVGRARGHEGAVTDAAATHPDRVPLPVNEKQSPPGGDDWPADKTTPVGRVGAPLLTQSDIANEQPLVRRLVLHMWDRATDSLVNVCPGVWKKRRQSVSEDAIKAAVRKANDFLERHQAGWCISREGEELRRE
jgi:hypothetical protein